MDYIDKINKQGTDYELKDSKAARSVDGDTSHVQEANEIYTTTSQSQTDAFAFRTAAGAMSINSGPATISTIYGTTIQTGHTDEVLNVTGSFQTEGTTAELNKETWRTQALEDGTYIFAYDGTNWKLEDTTVTLATYGLTVSGTVVEGDSISVEYVALVVGTLSTATPTSFKATGFNQYNATAGYAHVVGGNQYRVAGTYTQVQFATTPTGAKSTVTVENNKFTPEEDGYIFVTGSGNILVALVWSGTMDSEPWSAYSDNGFNIPTTDADGTQLPTATYGFPSVHGVRDEIDFAGKLYQQRIGHYAYSAQNLATVEALGVDYIYDLSDIFYVLPDLVVYELANTVSGAYEVNDYGTEEYVGTDVPLTTVITYGNSLVDKLRNLADVQSIGTGLTLGSNGELSVAGGGGPTVVQDIGDSTADVMSQKAVTDMVYYKANNKRAVSINVNSFNHETQFTSTDRTITISNGERDARNRSSTGILIGDGDISGNRSIGIGTGFSLYTNSGSSTDAYNIGIGHGVGGRGGKGLVIIGSRASMNYAGTDVLGCIVLGYGSGKNINANGMMDIGVESYYASLGYGYSNTQYRLITGVHDGVNAHDACTKGQLDAAVGNIETVLATLTTGTGA